MKSCALVLDGRLKEKSQTRVFFGTGDIPSNAFSLRISTCFGAKDIVGKKKQ